MARRRHESFAQGSLDSLLDTMTNVVGVLIVVLIVTQLNVSSAAKRIRANLPEVTVRMMEELQEKDEETRKRLEELAVPQEATAGQVEDARQELRAALAKRDELRKSEQDLKGLQAELANLQREIEALDQQMAAEGGALAQIRSEIRERESELADQEPKLVRLPNPRPPDEGSKEVRMIVRGGRLLHFDRESILNRLAARITARKDLLSGDPKHKDRYDREKITAFLQTLKESDPNYRLEFVIHPSNGHIQVHCYPRDGHGETVEELAGSGARGRRVMAEAFGDRNYLRYFVTADSFETYSVARRMAEKIQIPVGWVFADDTARQTLNLSDRKIYAEPDPDYKPPEPQPGPAPPPPPPRAPRVDILD